MKEKLKITNSLRYFKKAKKLIPSCTQTFSKGYTQFSFGVSPIFIKEGNGCHVWDIDSNRFIDYMMALGPVILGYNHPAVTGPVMKALMRGTIFSMPHSKEVELAELLCKIIPCSEMVRFGKNGSDATSGAIRAARAFTKRDMVACSGYHGWQDWYIGSTVRNAGVPKAVSGLTLTFEYNNIQSLEKLFREHRNKIACVIMEPMGVIYPKGNFLKDVAQLTRKEGALLIFDECWTGFRLALGGAQGYFKVKPDMACFGKALGNGFPISAIVGRREVMKIFDKVFYSFTFAGDLIGITAGIAVINFMRKNPVIKRIEETGKDLCSGIREIIHRNNLGDFITLKGYPARNVLEFRNKKGDEWWALKSLIQQEMHKRGVLFGGFHAVSYSHTKEDIKNTLKIYGEVFEYAESIIAKNKVKSNLKGDVVKPIFREP